MFFLFIAFVGGCADFNSPVEELSVQRIVNQGPEFTVGMKKNAVLKDWGMPDEKKVVGRTKWGAEIECWTYRAFVPGFPVDYKYVSSGRNLYFEGNALARWEEIKNSEVKPPHSVEKQNSDFVTTDTTQPLVESDPSKTR